MQKRPRWIGFLLVIVSASFWGIAGTVSQRLFQRDGISVEWLVSARLLLGGIILLAISSIFGNRRKIFDVWKNKETAIQIVIFGILGMLAVQYTYMASINLGNAAIATLLQYLAPVFIILYIALSNRTKIKGREFFAVMLALSGTFLLLTNGSIGTFAVPMSAVVWGIISAVALAFYTLYPGRMLKKFGSLNVMGWSMLIGGLGMNLIHPIWKIESGSWSIETLLFTGFVILFGTIIAFWFYLESLLYLTPQETSLLGTIEPLAAIITSVLWLQIPFGLMQMIGGFTILFMVLYLSLFKEKEYVDVDGEFSK